MKDLLAFVILFISFCCNIYRKVNSKLLQNAHTYNILKLRRRIDCLETKDFYGKLLKIATIFGLLVVVVLGFDKIRTIFDTILSAFMPFLVGGLIAVILNIPVRFFENKLFKKQGKIIDKIKRPISINLYRIYCRSRNCRSCF